jgi:multidrug efflux pump subunit AcrA (membrane-fusion protein)
MNATLPPAPSTLPAPGSGAALALALHAEMLAQPRRAEAAQGLVIGLARRLGFDRCWLALCQGQHGELRLLASSDGSLPAQGSAAHRQLLAACAESFDQCAAVRWPEAPDRAGALPRITRAHAAVAADAGSGASTAGVPLAVDGALIGALCVLRPAGPAIDDSTVEQLEHLACLAAPLLALMDANERSAPRRARDAMQAWWAAASAPRQRSVRQLGAAAALVATVALLMPWPAQVGGRARLEGAVQRVLSAPVDGFVQQVHARAGDTVRAGQALIDLADQDLQLERQSWQSQLAQHLDGLATAQARADRAQLVLLQNRADEAQAQLELVDERLQRARLVAPFDAIVVQGDWSQQLGAPVKEGAELLTLAPNGRFRVIVEIDERDIAQMERAAATPLQGSLTLSALPWDTLPLRVTRISPMAKAVEGRNVFDVEAELLSPPPGLRPGLQGSARIATQPASPLLHLLRRGLGALRLAWWEWLG